MRAGRCAARWRRGPWRTEAERRNAEPSAISMHPARSPYWRNLPEPPMTRAFLAALTAVASLCCTGAASAASRPVVLELFTSQGCSSCPPAEAYLRQLSTRPDVIALAFHVDYWDDLGWRDRFALH